MSIEKKSLISNRMAVKKANLTKPNATKVSSTKTSKLAVSLVKARLAIRNHLSTL